MKELQTRPLHPQFGVELLDIDLRNPTDELMGAIDGLWVEHPVLLVRGQLLDEAQQIKFSRKLGPTNIHVRTDIRSRWHPEVVLVSNLRLESGQHIGALASGEAAWHTDSCYKVKPDTGSILYALEVPPEGGKTSWANTQLAYEALSREQQDQIAGLRGQFAYQIYSVDIQGMPDTRALRDLTPDVAHPMVLTQPGTGRRGLYIDPLQTYGIESMALEDARPLLDELANQITRPEFIYQHEWRRGDVVFWDNCRVLHRREPFDPAIPRLLKRTTIFLPPERYPVPFQREVQHGR